MTVIIPEPGPPPADGTPEYAEPADVVTALGQIGTRLPAGIVVSEWLSMAHAELVDRLARVYERGIPTFAGDGLNAVRWAEAKLAAAAILEALRALFPDVGETPERLRTSALVAVEGGVVGYPPGSYTDDPLAPGVPVHSGPRVSSHTSTSLFPDPYEDGRRDPLRPWL